METEVRICRNCGRSFPRNSGNNWTCGSCRTKASVARKRAFLDAYKAEKGCAICGENDPIVLDPHHLDGATKHRGYRARKQHGAGGTGVSDIVNSTYGLAKLEAELALCVILCKNCHARVHAGTAELPEQED